MKTNLPITDIEVLVSEDTNILSTTNPKGAVTYANQDFIDISGFTTEELMGKNHNKVRHPDMPPAAFADLWQTIKSGESWMGIVKNRCKNGDYYWVNAYVTPIEENGTIVEYQSVRGKPKEEYVTRAEQLYRNINAGKIPGWLKRKSIKLSYKLIAAVTVVQLIVAAIPFAFGTNSSVTALTSVGLGVVIAAALLTWLLRPLDKVFAKTGSIFNNPIARHIFTGQHDEVGQVLLALKFLEDESRGIVGRVSESSQIICDDAEDLKAAIDTNNSNISQQHIETDQVVTAITEMSASIQEVSTNAQLSADAAMRVYKETKASKDVVQSTMDHIKSLTSDIQQANDVMNQLENESEQINTVISVINAIAEQTNLLALNAAIEAARAGEQGRGFAVVADEVRTLANRTHKSTKEIQQMIENLQSGTLKAVDAISGSRNKAEECVSEADKAASSLDEITQAISSINDMNVQIATAVEEQNAVTQDVNKSIVTIRELSEATLTGISASQSSSDEMNQQSTAMNKLVEQFWAKRKNG